MGYAMLRKLTTSERSSQWIEDLLVNRGSAPSPFERASRGERQRYAEAISIESAVSTVFDYKLILKELLAAERALRNVMEESPLFVDAGRALGRNLWFQGRFHEAIDAFVRAEGARDLAAKAAGVPANVCVVLPRNCAQSIGLMGHMDGFIKRKILKNDRRPYFLFAPQEAVINDAFLGYWKNYITVITEPAQIAKLSLAEHVYSVNWNWIFPKGRNLVFVHEGMAATQRAWFAEKNGRPLLSLSEEHANALAKARAKWGMNAGDRFVCLHIRSSGFYGDVDKAQRFRNTPIEDYYSTIRDLAEKGLWIIRMGDATMPRLDISECNKSGRVIDYARSDDKSAELDVALCASCELFISSSSGLHTVAHAFGRPVCEINHSIYAGFPWHTHDTFIPQLYFSHKEQRVLGLQEVLGSSLVYCDHHFLLEAAGVSLIRNDPDDIVETVREALSPSLYQEQDPAMSSRVKVAFKTFNERYDRGISGNLGRYYATKYAAQLLTPVS